MNSDKTKTLKQRAGKAAQAFAMAVATMLMAAFTVSAQEPYVFIEGSIHSFRVTDNPANTFAWSMDIDPYSNVDLDPSAYDLIEGGNTSKPLIRQSSIKNTILSVFCISEVSTAAINSDG